MKPKGLPVLCCCSLLFSLAQQAQAAATYPELVVDDMRHVLSSPSRWERREWQNFGWATLAVAGTAAIVDRPLRDEMRRQSGSSNFMREVERFGAEYSLVVLGGFYLAGTVGSNDKAISVAQDGLAASIIASGIITPALKYVAGRSRPRDNAGIYDFKPLRDSNASFPSGHTTEAFALASVISSHYEEGWVRCSAYTVAGLVGVARSYHGAHFASDVLAGALIGTLVGESVVAHNQSGRSRRVALLPQLAPGQAGVRLAGSF